MPERELCHRCGGHTTYKRLGGGEGDWFCARSREDCGLIARLQAGEKIEKPVTAEGDYDTRRELCSRCGGHTRFERLAGYDGYWSCVRDRDTCDLIASLLS